MPNYLKCIVISFICWRVLLIIPLYVGNVFIPYRESNAYTNVFHFIQPYYPANLFFLHPWANFDGIHYLNIAARGYIDEGRFFPLYPLIIGIVGKMLGGLSSFDLGFLAAAFIFSNLFFLGSLIILYKLILLDFSERIAKKAVIFLLLFPTSFFFGSLYAESLFLFLTLLSFYCIYKQKWFLAGIFVFLLMLTKFLGVVMLPVLIWEYIKHKKLLKGKFNLKLVSLKLVKLFPFALVPTGLLGYAYFNFIKWGDALYFLNAHGLLANGREVNQIVLFPQTIFRYTKILLTLPVNQFEWIIALLELATFFLVGALIYYCYKKRLRTSYIIFAVFSFLIPTLSGTFSGLPRYVLVIFPIFILLALIHHKILNTAYVLISLVLLFLLTMYFSRGFYVA